MINDDKYINSHSCQPSSWFPPLRFAPCKSSREDFHISFVQCLCQFSGNVIGSCSAVFAVQDPVTERISWDLGSVRDGFEQSNIMARVFYMESS
jgi:hypothetical protein